MAGADERLQFAPGEEEQQKIGEQLDGTGVEQPKTEKLPPLSRRNRILIQRQPRPQDGLVRLLAVEEILHDELRAEGTCAQGHRESRGGRAPGLPAPDERLQLTAGGTHT